MRLVVLILASSACCVFGIREEWIPLDDLNGGTPVYQYAPQPFVTTLNVKRGYKNIVKQCTASLLRIYYGAASFLTAAECFDERENANYTLTFIRGNSSGNPEEIFVSRKIYIHKCYKKGSKTDNVAIFTVFTLDKFKGKIPFMIPYETFEGPANDVEILEWKSGKDDEDDWRLYSTQTQIISPPICSYYFPDSPIQDRHLCVDTKIGQNLHEGQIGTPLVERDRSDPDKFWLLGIATIVRPFLVSPEDPPATEFLEMAPYTVWMRSVLGDIY